jgi:branched-chain amino acid transport system permease protein
MLLQQIANGIMLGSTSALVAIGYTLVFGVLRLLHLAHGEVYMVGAFIGLQLMLWLPVGPITAILGALVGCALLGVVLEFIAFRPIRRRGGHFLAPIVSTIGAGLVLQEIATKLFGAEQVGFPQRLEPTLYHFGAITLSSAQLLILVIAFSAMLLLHLFISRTRYGMAMRATAESLPIASILGIDVNKVIVLTFAVASALGGVAGVLVGLAFNAISPFMGTQMVVKGMAVMLIGGLGNVYGAMVGGLVLGLVEVLSVAYLASSYRDAFAFSLMIVILLVRPQGLFGRPLEQGH